MKALERSEERTDGSEEDVQVIPEITDRFFSSAKVDESSNQKPEKPRPPRPAALPNRPPQPPRPAVGPTPLRPAPVPSPSTVSGAQGSFVKKQQQQQTAAPRQPMRPHMVPGAKKFAPQKVIAHIGMPTNVTHTGHAKTAEEAQKLIEKLMAGGLSADLPAPMQPAPGLEKNGRDADQREKMDGATNPQPMPRTKSAFDVGHEEPIIPPNFLPLVRNQSDTSLDARDADLVWQRPPLVPEPLVPLSRPVPVPAARTVPVRTPSVHSTANEGEDQDNWVSLPPPKSLPPVLPQEFGRGPPPPVPSSRPVGAPGPSIPPQGENPPTAAPRRDVRQDLSFDAADPPVKPMRPISSFAGAVPTPFAAEMFAKPAQFSSPTDDLKLLSQISSATDDNDERSTPLFVTDPIPSIPPRPRAVPPARPPVGVPAIPARSSVPPVQGPPPLIPPRQGTSS